MYNITYLGVFRFTDMEIAKIFITYRGYWGYRGHKGYRGYREYREY